MTQLLNGDAAFVTGAGRGIGRGIVTELARHGCDVAINDIDAEIASEIADALAEFFSVETVAVPVTSRTLLTSRGSLRLPLTPSAVSTYW